MYAMKDECLNTQDLELQIKLKRLSDDFEVSWDKEGKLHIKNLIEDYELPEEEIHILLTDEL